MSKWKNGLNTNQVARKLLRSYIVRCHKSISNDFPEVTDYSAEESADYLLHLKDTGRIDIALNNISDTEIGCKITEIKQSE